MTLTLGTRYGAYDILAVLGTGGMGAVYRARDTRLGRVVALKVLLPAVANDPDRLARFTREAQTLAALNHPHIAQIYGVEESDGVRALVMELVEGQTLADRLARGPVPLDEALPIARQLADALAAAHEQGIIHRDLKPANIVVRADGTVKVLDFGLAKALDPAGTSAVHPADSPTVTSPALTHAGIILGTAAYMAPEQARGQLVDRRADLWAFGVVLFEMLTGTRLFEGATVSDTLAAVLTRTPDWSLLPAATPTPVRTLLRRCIERDRGKRLDSAADARLEIDDGIEAPREAKVGGNPAPQAGWWPWLLTAAVSAGLLALALPAWRHARERRIETPGEMRVEITTPATDDPVSFALSPDGRQIAFVASGDGPSRLWLRSLASTSARPLMGTDGASLPFWSPDSRSLGFFANGVLRRLDLTDETVRTLAPAPAGRGGTWNVDGVILFAPTNAGPLFRVAATGGNAAPVEMREWPASNQRSPVFLPDGQHFLFYARGSINLGALDGRAPKRLTNAESAGSYVPSGWLLWVRADTLVGQRLDLERGELTGSPIVVADAVTALVGNLPASVSAGGLIAVRIAGANVTQLTWFDRAGSTLGAYGEPDVNRIVFPNLSHDGRRLVVSRTVEGNQDLWLLDGTRRTRLTFDPSWDLFPIWSPDDSHIVFTSNRGGTVALYVRQSNGAGQDSLLDESGQGASDWSADGRFLLYGGKDVLQSGFDVWVRPMRGEGDAWPFLHTPFNESAARFSPDGRWVAYMSDESGRLEVYVRPFIAQPSTSQSAANAGQWQVSINGGEYPVWRRDGRELYYMGPGGEIMAVAATASTTSIDVGQPAALFVVRVPGPSGRGRPYDVSPDGRFLVNKLVESAPAPITLIQHWTPPESK